MAATTVLPPPLAGRIYGWRRVRVALGAAFVVSVILLPGWTGGWGVLLLRLSLIALVQLGVYGLIERWPRRLPGWIARWIVQLVAIAAVVPFAMAIIYTLTTLGDAVHWTHDKQRLTGYGLLTFMGILFGPWVAMGALYRHVSGQAQRQALAFELARSQYERNAAQTRLRQLHAQVEPHFLFNTLANVRELVVAGSPQAPAVLDSLIAYLRAAVPRLHENEATLGQEVQLARAYLELMHMRMPDRLQFSIDVDEDAQGVRCPPTTLLTLVENAVRHGIDPGEEGGRIDITANVGGGRCIVRVRDTGVGLQSAVGGLGTGLATLRERLQLVFDGDAQLRLASIEPHGACAEAEFPARRADA
jgi:sensor histidine kinase YesM